MKMPELVAACGWAHEDASDFIAIERLAESAAELLPEDPLLKNTRQPVPSEQEKIIRVLEDIFQHVNGDLVYAPDEFLVTDRGLFNGFALGSKAIVSTNILQQDADLQATIAHLLGWYNSSERLPYTDYLVAVRYAALPFHNIDEIPGGYRADYLEYRSDYSGRYQYRDKSIPKGHPGDLRPKPPGVLLAGGNNYSDFSHTEREQESSKTTFTYDNFTDVDSAQGVQAVTEYLSLYPDDREGRLMKNYFRHRHRWAEFFKYAQAEADWFVSGVLGQGEQLADMLERYQNVYTGEGVSSTFFGRPLAVRIAGLRGNSSLLKYSPTPPTPPRNRIAEQEAELARKLAEAEQRAAEQKKQQADDERKRFRAAVAAPRLAYMEKWGITKTNMQSYNQDNPGWGVAPIGFTEQWAVAEFSSSERFLQYFRCHWAYARETPQTIGEATIYTDTRYLRLNQSQDERMRYVLEGFPLEKSAELAAELYQVIEGGRTYYLIYKTRLIEEHRYYTKKYPAENEFGTTSSLYPQTVWIYEGTTVTLSDSAYYDRGNQVGFLVKGLGLHSANFLQWEKSGRLKKYGEPAPAPYKNPLLGRRQ